MAATTAQQISTLKTLTAEQRSRYTDLHYHLELLQLNVFVEEPEVLRSPQCAARGVRVMVPAIGSTWPDGTLGEPMLGNAAFGDSIFSNPILSSPALANPALGGSGPDRRPLDWDEAVDKHKNQMIRESQ
ncbi:MAG: hypothetical protein ACO331_04380 [Prochlorothrix sp.]